MSSITELKPSPGPWEIAQYENYKGFSIWAPGAGCIAERWYASEHEDAPIMANARLIVAAPKLFKALEDLLNAVTDGRTHGEEVYAAAQALAEARSYDIEPNHPNFGDRTEAELEHLSDKANIKPARGWMGNRGQFDPGD